MGNWTFGKKIGAGFALAGATLVLIATLGYRNARAMVENDRWVNHTHQARMQLSELLSLMTDAETGQRGFIITNDAAFLGPYEAAVTKVREVLVEARTLTHDNASQQRRLETAGSLIDQKLNELQTRIDQRKTQGFEATASVIQQGVGKRVMDDLRRVLQEADAEEQQLLHLRSAEAEASAQLTQRVVLGGSLLGALFVALIGWFVVQSLSTQIGDAVRHVQSSSTELQTAANQHAIGSKEQTTAMNEITTTMSELLATSRQIATSSQRVSQIALQTANAALSGDGTVDRGHQALGSIQRQVELTVNQVLELGKKSQQIGGVVDLVSELAEQTNILAINATIEASIAGESGKRFGVVADEIRKLADRVAGSAKQIRELIEDVRGSVSSTIMTTETGSKAADSGAKQFGEVATSFKQIASLVTMTTEAAKEIELSTKQQASAVEQVNAAIASVLQTSRETEVGAKQTLQTSSELSSLSLNLLRMIQPQVQASGT